MIAHTKLLFIVWKSKIKFLVNSRSLDYRELLENWIEVFLKILHLDNGGEYTTLEFDSFCRKAGTKRELIVPYNLQQNWVVDRKNRSIIEMAKAMIHDMDLPMFLWAEACYTIVYILRQE